MKSFNILLLVLFYTINTFGQGDEYEEYEVEDYPLNTFFRVTTNVFMVNSTPAILEFRLWDDNLRFPQYVEDRYESSNLQTYGLGFEVAHLFGDNYLWSINNHVGWADLFSFYTYIFQVGIGKEFELGRFYVDPMISLGGIFSSQRLATFNEFDNGSFLLDGSFIIDDMVAKFKSRGFNISPSISVDLPITEYISAYVKGGINYTLERNSFFRITGTTDEIDSEGDNITTYKRINFIDDRLDFRVNNEPILDPKSPYIHYNLNSVLLQFGVTLLFSSKEIMY